MVFPSFRPVRAAFLSLFFFAYLVDFSLLSSEKKRTSAVVVA